MNSSIIKYTLSVLILISSNLFAQQNTFENPILKGGYPDPSICRVGDDYYMVNSTFEYFPALPIHHSKDLVNWELIGYGLHRENQCNGAVNLVDVNSNGGIHAPTIRYHEGTFYIITTNVYYDPNKKENPTDFVNFIITAKSPEGPWSEPHVLEGAPGIDPDIFFDEDGKVWYVGTHSPENPNFDGEGEIWLQEIDLENWKLTGERNYLWRGACGGVWVEGPHMYKHDGRYYLMVAEGGTSFNHAVMIAVSDDIKGPYFSNPRNPILSTRHLTYDFWVNSTGHADLIQLEDGRWYMVALGIRGDVDRRSNMGRESHLIPVQWEREPFEWQEIKYDWPVCAPQTGRVERLNPVPFEGTKQIRKEEFKDEFDSDVLNLEWNFRRVPMPNTYSLSKREGHLRLFANPNVIKERGRASLMGFRQKESLYDYEVKMNFKSKQKNVEAGISLFQKDDNYINMTVQRAAKGYTLKLSLKAHDKEQNVIANDELELYKGEIILRVKADKEQYHFEYSLDNGNEFKRLTSIKNNYIISRGYTGAYLGMYCTSNGKKSNAYVDFDWVKCNYETLK
ncbi:glycoside hydrolase family 43 protein [Marinifilum breve]|uniref:Glycoside hydrolase family 43 protein n=1 Tax=Marinifilum breve TaxID=2184082 RepID=A0A2V3ZY96_9BACT|nr:glycoside hydrolase family 43 protein [Marinifilum breve]PXY01223.1 glycoside hydrolase family 43 protein [Marinifilum breve]